jgi:uncharacterized protein (DUF305 family)
MKKMTALLALLLAAVLTLAACGSEETSKSSGDTSTANAKFNDADVEFATDMIPHHEQAVQMSQMASNQAQSAEVKNLADDIAAAQGPEIDTMTQWLKDWGQDAPSDHMDHEDMGHGSSDELPGMMDADDMGKLGRAHGGDWDHMFLTMMIDHHEGAIEMAKTEQADGQNADAVALAKKIEAAQTTEIAQMKDMLKR